MKYTDHSPGQAPYVANGTGCWQTEIPTTNARYGDVGGTYPVPTVASLPNRTVEELAGALRSRIDAEELGRAEFKPDYWY